MTTVPGQLVWEIVKRNNSFLVKEFGNGSQSVQFSKEPNNLYNLNSYKHSGLANKKTVTIQPAGKDQSILLATSKTKKQSKPAMVGVRGLEWIGQTQTIIILVANNFYRPDLKKAALARLSAVSRSLKVTKSGAKKKNRQASRTYGSCTSKIECIHLTKQSSSTRTRDSRNTRQKEIAKPVTPQSESVSEEDSDPEQAQRDKDMQKNLALLAKYFKKLYKPTNNNLKTSSNSTNKTEDTTPRYNNDNQSRQFGNQRTVTVAGARETVGSPVVQKTGIQCFNYKGFGHYCWKHEKCRSLPKL
ncbi:60S ribosomal protein L28-2-like protein [Tanacetum coccineum]